MSRCALFLVVFVIKREKDADFSSYDYFSEPGEWTKN